MFDQRVAKLRQKLKEQKIDAFLISNFYNILYLTGFKTLSENEREAFVLVTKKNVYLFTDERYLQKNQQLLINNFQLRFIEPHKGLLLHLQEIVKTEEIKSLGFEGEDIKYLEYQRIQDILKNIELKQTQNLLIRIREIKDQKEILKITKACEIGDRCLGEIIKLFKPGISEKEIAFKIEMWLKEKNYDIAFDPMVAFDKNSALPHYNTKAGEGILINRSIIMIDFGVKYEDYLSDITRIFFYKNPGDEIMNIYNTLLSAQEKTLQEMIKNKKLSDLDLFCRKLITSYPHSTGHGVGLEIHEYPKVSTNSLDLKLENQIFTVEPGVYFEEKFGMRIEDTVVIRDRKAEILTKFSKDILIL